MREQITPAVAAVAALWIAPASFAVPMDWTIELVARSSLDPNTPAFRLPNPSSLSSQYVTLDEQGRIAVRVFINTGSATEGIFVGTPASGWLVLTASGEDPVWSTALDLRNGRFAAQDATLGPSGASVFDVWGDLVQRYEVGLLGVDGGLSLADDGAIGYRGFVGLAGQALVLDEFVGPVRQQTQIFSTLSLTDDVDFILTPAMNASKSFVVNHIPASGPSRRILRFDPGPGGYSSWLVAETGGEFNAFVNSTAISPDGRAAFTARRSADSIWQVSRRDSAASPIVSIARGGDMGIVNGNLANFPPVVNSNGLVAFRVQDAAGSTALYAGDGNALVRVLGFGDTVQTDLGPLAVGFDFGGTTGVQVMNGVVDINDNNQIAFAAFLENGTIGVFLATPASSGGCNPADLTEPFGVLDLADLQTFVAAFVADDPIADLAPPSGVWDLADMQAFVSAFLAGCP
jgi:hypothetical protein